MIDLVSALDAATAKRIKQYPHPINRASELGNPCERFLVLARTQTDKMGLHDIGLQRIFDEGHIHEVAVLREIEDAGIEVVEQQRPYLWQKFELSGRIDAKIKDEDGALIPLEIKSCSSNVFRSVKDKAPKELLDSSRPWIRKYPAQVLAYAMMACAEHAILLFKNKETGEKCQKVFGVIESLEYMESNLKKLERVNKHVAEGTVPEIEIQKSDECQRCGFAKTICFPNVDFGPGYEMFTDEEWIAKLDRLAELEDVSKEHRELYEQVREAFSGKNAVVGNWKIESKEVERKEFTVKASKYWKLNIEPL